MFSVVVGGKALGFRFRHMDNYPTIQNAKIAWRRITVCTAIVLPREEGYYQNEIGVGIAICHLTDQFSRAIGRRVALGKLLQKLFPNRKQGDLALRQKVWDVYFGLGLRGEWDGCPRNQMTV